MNYNAVPFDIRKPFDPSGIRIGVCAVTSRGFTEKEMIFIGEKIDAVVNNTENVALHAEIAEEVKKLCSAFPAPGLEHLF